MESSETTIPPVDLPRVWLVVDGLIVNLTKAVLVAVGGAFTILVTTEVLSRFLFDTSISQTNALARFLLVWFFMLGAGLALRQAAHVGLDSLSRRLSQFYRNCLYALAQALMLVFFLELLWGGYVAYLASLSQVEGSLGVSLAWVMAAFPAGVLLLIYHQAVLLADFLRQYKREEIAA